MGSIGEGLRIIRAQWGLSLREVKDRSAKLAQDWGSRSYEISGSWLARIETGKHEITVSKLITLATIYSRPPEDLLREFHPDRLNRRKPNELPGPNTTLLVSGGSLESQAKELIPDGFSSYSIPEDTMLLPQEKGVPTTPYRRAIIGRKDCILSPMVQPGSIVKIDTQMKAIASRKDWSNEFDRPIYLFYTHVGYVCSWCELDKEGMWLSLVPHSLSEEPIQRWRYRKDVEVIGRVVAIAMRLTT